MRGARRPLFALVEFTPTEFRIAYVSSATRALYGVEGDDDEAMYDYFATVHEYVNLDLAEIDLFTESLFPMADDVRYITTALDMGKMVRVYLTDDRGVFVAMPSDAPVESVVTALRDATEA
ncbi:hypothetical protein [Halosegnis marinus]|uniref:Uncharacterized protein n=1 Tax=Halosegnis marinus TaxID=3034023 RepID=A0ABD5ZSS6_9EURY|nr:hypothetical protein [Halosegnis sp. DT85]